MLDFLMIDKRQRKNSLEIYPKFVVNPRSKDLMIRGGDFYAVWNDEKKLWSLDEQDVIEQVDAELEKCRKEYEQTKDIISVAYMWDSDSGSIDRWHKYCWKQMRDRFHPLDEKVIFSNTETKKTDYATKKLDYPLEAGSIKAYDELISTLYSPEERAKIEWAIGAIISGDSKHIQKFIVLYGSAGTGKSTVLNIIQQLFDGYFNVFDAKELASSSNDFALESFSTNPLVSIQHDGDLSRIEDNTKLNSIVSHEIMLINEKHKKKYPAKFNTFLFMGTNKPVRITEAKSGLIRRLIDVTPTGNKIPYKKYLELTSQIKFERGAIAKHCLDRYLEMGESYYDKYVARDMISATNDFYDFIEFNFDDFKRDDSVTLSEAWRRYKTYCEYANVQYPFSMRALRVELKNYFREFYERGTADNKAVRNLYSGFITEKFESSKHEEQTEIPDSGWLNFDQTVSSFDILAENYPAQYAKKDGTPLAAWDGVKTTLKDISTNKLHYVRVPENHIVIDFDIKDADGNKSLLLNLAAASKFPQTYAELSKSGAGIHLHYIYAGDVTKLSRVYADNVEVKVFTGKSSLRRKLTKCNDIPIATINSGLPVKGEVKVLDWDGVKSERMLRTIIMRDLNKEYMGATKPSCDHIYKILEEAYEKGIPYDVSDLRQPILIFAMNSTHQSDYCLELLNKMKFKSESNFENKPVDEGDETRLVFFDIEIFPNLFLVNWKYEGAPKCVRMINPTSNDIEELVKKKLVGFNNRRYDNHILYARMEGYTVEQLYRLSQRLINSKEVDGATFSTAYKLSYADVYDICSKKQSLKKWEIELGIHHQELGLRWDDPVPENRWEEVAAYCDNDVIATEAVFHARKQDFVAREILAELSGLTVNDTTRTHITKIIFGNNKEPELVYTDLSETFPGYEFVRGEDNKMHNMYMGEDASFGGYVYSEPGMYTNVALLDVASLHPHSIIAMNVFGEYTQRFKDILDARIAIKHHDYDHARNMLDGKLEKYLGSDEDADNLAQALKIVINSVYGYTSATFPNPFKDPRNKNNIVALRGALFMISLKHEVQSRGFRVAHIKTDSIKIPDATSDIIKFCMDYAKQYGYSFEHEATYQKMCLVNDAVYVAKYADPDWCQAAYGYLPDKIKKHGNEWTATGTQFQIPYVFKTLFSHEAIGFEDKCEAKSVSKGALYLDRNENLPEGEHAYVFVGRVGLFCPIKAGCGGAELMRGTDDGKYYAVTGTKGYRWLESEEVKLLNKQDDIDDSYYIRLVDNAVNDISSYGDFEWFISDDPAKQLLNTDFINVPEDADEEAGIPFN